MEKELLAVVLPNQKIQLEWVAATGKINKTAQSLQNQIWKQYQKQTNNWLLFIGFIESQAGLSPSLDFWRNLSSIFVETLIQIPDLEAIRDRVLVPLEDQRRSQIYELMPPMVGSEYVGLQTISDIWRLLNHVFIDEINPFQGTVETFFKSFRPDIHLVGRVFFHLVENDKTDDPFAFLATYSTRVNDAGNSSHLPLRHALEEFSDDKETLLELLVTVQDAAKQSGLINELLESGEIFHPLSLSASDAYTFLREIPLYEASGILCRIPNWWRGASASVSLNFRLGDNEPTIVGMDSLLDFRPRLLIGDTEISETEARQLLTESNGLAFIKNKWVAVEPDKLAQTLDAYENAEIFAQENDISLYDALKLQLNPQKMMGVDSQGIISGFSHGDWLRTVMENLRRPETIPGVTVSSSFQAKLRDYQHRGLNWLCFLDGLRLGACLADDMGLGKTIQLLAFLDALKSRGTVPSQSKKPSLLIIPASLIANWQAEIERFSPGLKVVLAHAESRSKKNQVTIKPSTIQQEDLVITTYGMVQKYDWIQSYHWRYIVLDEAQAIKNPGTKQTRAVKALTADNRIIMTGTPIENKLSDLWSLFDFLNPGLLGNTTEFKQFVKRLEKDTTGYARLRTLVSPFILRRLKTDKAIISDLPNKVETKSWATLSKKQIVLYRKAVADIQSTIEKADGIQRRGLILAALTKFKQLCNHPDQYLGAGDFLEKDSGKFTRLREICETIHEKREKALIFTQFKEMTEPIRQFLHGIFNQNGLVLHGSVSLAKRKKMIDQFQSDEYIPFMVLSLKAGGVGLNLTEANHVIHFDRWWNPAVENQATDRAFRIGQKKNVMVHKFLTKGTIEEKIDQMLERKARLSDEIISETGEKWITEMSNDELISLFSLGL